MNGNVSRGGAPQTLKWISIKWASQKAFARFFMAENNNQWDNDKFTIVKRIKKGFFEFCAINVIILGALIMVLSNFILPLKKISMAF